MKKPKWILENVIYSIHSEQIAEHGGDEGLLKSALNAPRQLFHYEKCSILRLAATYAYRIMNNHPFIDGNKRVGYIAARLFLIMNGYDLKVSEEERATVFLGVANNSVTENELIKWFEKCYAMTTVLNRSVIAQVL